MSPNEQDEDDKSSNTPKQHHRRLSLPDLEKLRKEWDKREAIQTATQLPLGKLQVII
jgi:hypothetical protein